MRKTVEKEAAFRCAMEDFMRGEWTLEHPTRPGTYPAYARAITQTGAPSWVVVYEDPRTQELKSIPAWGGWFWSEPLPDFPPTPDAEGG